MRTVLITGTAGFIGFHLATLLLKEGFRVVGYDGMTPYYDVSIKRHRHQMLKQSPAFTHLIDLAAERFGGQVLWCTDDFFAEKENLIKL